MNGIGLVVVGAGEAGTRAAIELRRQGWNGSITLIGEEKLFPYERPPLSKDCLTKKNKPTPVHILDDQRLKEYNITWISDNPVMEIDRDHHTVKLKNGQQIQYERLLLATGSRARKLVIEGSEISQAFYLRTYHDALTLRNQLYPGIRVAIIGGGFIGLEVAASAKMIGCSVTLIEVAPRILMRGVPEEIAHIVEDRHRKEGVQFRIGTGIQTIEKGHKITFTDGTFDSFDVIVVGIGAIPETSLAEQCGLEIENGIRVDERLRTSDPDIFAAGDCCSFPHILYDGKRIRLESWRNAHDQGIHAAGNMLGNNEPYVAVPWFWSDQYDFTLQVAGLHDHGEMTIVRDLEQKGKIFYRFTSDCQLVAASGIGTNAIAKDIRVAERLIEKQIPYDIQLFKNPNVKLKSLLKS